MPLRILSPLSRSTVTPNLHPPPVDTLSTNATQTLQQVDNTELPAYTAESSNVETITHASNEILTTHRIDLPTSSKPRPWLWMILQSEAPNDKSLPVFVEKPVVGSVEMEVPVGKPSTVTSVSVSLKGQIMASYLDSRPFWEVTQVLWDSSMPLPIATDTPQGSAGTGSRLTVGRYSWPFTFTLPHEVTFSEKVASEAQVAMRELLPPSFRGRGYHSGINYTLVVDVKRTGMLKTDRSLSTAFGYLPLSFPPRPSRLREIAYMNNVVPPAPMEDPDGWTVLPEVEMHGTAFKQRKVTVRCTLALANPLEYTRGCVVSLFLVLRSADEQILDVLAHPHAPVVQMRMKIKTLIGVDAAGGALPQAQNTADVPLSRAQWWRPSDVESSASWGDDEGDGKFRRCMMGEMTLPSSLTPSFTFGKFDLRYVVDMYPFGMAGFEPINENNRLSRTEIVVHTGFAQQSPRPRAYLPPGYFSVNAGGAGAPRDTGRQLQSSGFL